MTTPSPNDPQLPAIVLAAGLSSRMGQSKPLLAIAGKPLIRHVIESLILSSALSPIIIVIGHEGHLVRTAIADLPITTVSNPCYATGEMLSSLLTGIGALPANCPGFLLAFADQPAVLPDTIAALVNGFFATSPSAPLVLPVYTGKRGHPVVVSCSLVPDIRALSPDDSLKSVVHKHLSHALMLNVDDPAVLEDLDTPEDVARAQAHWPQAPAVL